MKTSGYDLYDLELDEYIGKGITREEVSNLTGLFHKNVSSYPRENRIYQNRYIIECHGSYEIDVELLKEWDKVRLQINTRAKR